MPSPSTIESNEEPVGSGQPESPALVPALPGQKKQKPAAAASVAVSLKWKKKKPAPAGVVVNLRTVAVDGQQIEMPETEQVKLPWQ